MPGRLSAIVEAVPQLIASAILRIDTRGAGFIDITADATSFIDNAGAGEGVLLIFLRHTSASLTIQENADPDVQADLLTALDRLAPENANWIHDAEGPDDMRSGLWRESSSEWLASQSSTFLMARGCEEFRF